MNEKKSISNFQRTGILITLLAASFITSMSTTVTGNMIPNFTKFFGISSNLAQWLTSGATLISGITIPITAFLIKRTPNKVYFCSAMTAFTFGSLGATLAVNFPLLLICRLLQAVGCGMLLSFAQVVLLKLYPKEKHGTIMAGIGFFSLYFILGLFFTDGTSIIYIAAVFALQSVAMATFAFVLICAIFLSFTF